MGGRRLKFYFPITGKLDQPVITLTPSQFCWRSPSQSSITDNNPRPVFILIFQSHNKSVEKVIEPSPHESKLLFVNLKVKDSGTYISMTINRAMSNSPNATSLVSLYVLNLENRYHGCFQCRYLKLFKQKSGKTVCIIKIGSYCSSIYFNQCYFNSCNIRSDQK